MTQETNGYDTSDAEFVTALKKETSELYRRLFLLGVGSRFHAFLEWCGVMGEHLNIVSDLIEQGHDPFDMNRHTGQTLPVAPYRLAYMAEKMECIFDGTISVRAMLDEQREADLQDRLASSISDIVERSTRASHHHATRKALTRQLVEAAMQEIRRGIELPEEERKKP